MSETKIIRLSKSCLGVKEKQAVMDVLDKEYLGMGKEVQEFENALTSFFGRPALCVTNGTAALHLALQACNIGPGDEVLVPSLTYVASFQAISATGAKPIACDIDPEKLSLNLHDSELRLTKNTKVIMPVHYTGSVSDLESIYTFSKRYNLRVIEDAAHAFGTKYNDKRIGGFGDISCFSFDGIKNITCGEGGCIVTDDEKILDQIKDARLIGVEKDTEKRYTGQRSWEFDVSKQGWRYHMSNIMAAIGIEQLNRFDEFSRKRQEIAKFYDLMFKGNSRILTVSNDYEVVVPHIYVVRILGLKNRKNLQLRLLEKNIQTGVHYQPNHWLSLYRNNSQRSLPITDEIYPQLLSIPLHPDLSFTDVEYVAKELINEILND